MCYVTVHESGVDNAIYVGDGSTGWFRLNPHQVGADISGENAQVWSPNAQITNGCQMLQSIVTAPGLRELLIGSPSGGNVILKRDMSVFTDGVTTGPTILQSVAATANGTTSVSATFPNPVAAGSIVYLSFVQVESSPVSTGVSISDNQGNGYGSANWGVGNTGAPGNFHGYRMNGPNTTAGTLTLTVASTDLGSGNPNSNWQLMAVEMSGVSLNLGSMQADFGPNVAPSFHTGTGNVTLVMNSSTWTGYPWVEVVWAYCADDTLATSDAGYTPLQSTANLKMGWRTGAINSVSTSPWTGGTGGSYFAVGYWAGFGGSPATAYDAWFEIGAVTMVFPGQRAAVKFVEMDFESVGTQPQVSYVLDDPTPTSPAWNALTNFVFDPPVVYGGTAITPAYWPDRFYINQNADVAVGRRIRLKVDFGMDAVRNELISWAIFGKKYVEQ